MNWENLTLAVTSWVFSAALLPSIVRRRPPHPLSSLVTAAGLVAVGVAEAGLGLALAAGSTWLSSALWLALFVEGLRA